MAENNTTILLETEGAVLGLALVFCIILLAVGFKDRVFWLVAGPVWIICGLAVFLDYGEVFMLLSVGVGLFLFIRGALDVL
jgi:hypothetical protein